MHELARAERYTVGSIGDCYELIDHQVTESQNCLNVYFYRLDTPVVGNAAQFLCESFIDNVLPDIQAIQEGGVTHTAISARNLFDDAEAHTELISETGDMSGESLPTFNAVGFRLVGSNAAVRDGQKRFVQVPESAQVNSIITDPTFIAALTGLAVTLATGLPIGLDADALIPIIVQRIAVGSSYRLPENSGEAVISEILDALYNIDVTSQTSRKIGRGE